MTAPRTMTELCDLVATTPIQTDLGDGRGRVTLLSPEGYEMLATAARSLEVPLEKRVLDVAPGRRIVVVTQAEVDALAAAVDEIGGPGLPGR